MATKVYNFRNIVGNTDLLEQLKKMVTCSKQKCYKTNVTWQTACMAVNPDMVE